MAEDVILSVKNISKSFGDLQVLKEIGFDIHKGEKIAILGPRPRIVTISKSGFS